MIAILLLLLGFQSPQATGVTAAFPFTDHAVLQRDRPIPVWGRADTDGAIRVSLAGQTIDTVSIDGRWMVTFKPMPAGGPHRLTIQADRPLSFEDILIGEVWVASGQSNMEWRMHSTLDAAAEMADMTPRDIRYLHMPVRIAAEPQDTASTEGWMRLDPESARDMSAVAWYFASMLRDSMKVPVGIIQSFRGATRIESWIPPKHIRADEDHAAMAARADQPHHIPAALYNAMIHPITPIPAQGVIWYQGESNAIRAVQYTRLMRTLVYSWREAWNDPDLDFLYVQLANFNAKQVNPVEAQAWPELRESQRMASTLHKTGMAVAADVGEADDIHPRDKKTVGHRLARIALKQTYGRSQIVHSGPVFAGFEPRGHEVVVRFEETAGGLVLRDAPRSGFAVAGADRVFHWATARVEGNTIVLHSPAVQDAVAVRYAWADNPFITLYNTAGLPASPFRSDAWYLTTEANR